MPFKKWHTKVEKKVQHVAERHLAWRTAFFSFFLFLMVFWYINATTPYNPLNKAMADTAVILIGFSMVLSSVCYFWDFFDTKIIYRKHLGLAGFAFGVAHMLLSWGAFTSLLQMSTWESGKYGPAFSGLLALIIFAVMALVSNRYSAIKLGGIAWRRILRMGYPALALVALHIILLKSKYWVQWVQEGFQSLPSMSFLMTVFILWTLVMRIALEISLRRQRTR